MTVLRFPRPVPAPRTMTVDDLDRALGLYRELHSLLLAASRLAIGDTERFVLSRRYYEVRADLSGLFARYLGTAG